jgi:hypothetical protein
MRGCGGGTGLKGSGREGLRGRGESRDEREKEER